MDKGFLESRGIKALIITDDGGGAKPDLAFMGKIWLTVRKEDKEKAKQILRNDNSEVP